MGELYPHNKKVYDMVLDYFKDVNKVAVVQATGTGKGYLASEFVNVAFKGKRILILAPNKDILMNYEKNFNIKANKNIKVKTYTGMDSMRKLKPDDFNKVANMVDLLILDEFHRLGAVEWGKSIQEMINTVEKRNGKVLGLTATPIRYNDTSIFNNPALSDEEKMKLKKARNMADEIFEGNVIQGITLEEAVYRGILPSFKYILGSYGYESAVQEGYEDLANLRELYGEGHLEVRRLEKELKEIESKFGPEKDNLRKLIQTEIKDFQPYQKWIVFCKTAEQLKSIDEDISYWFNKDINEYKKGFKISPDKINLYSVLSEENTKENEANLSAFYDAKEGLNIIKCINKLNEGAHVPNVTGIIMLRSTLSPIVYLQQIGRALSAGNKNFPIIFDFMGNIENMQRVSNGEDEYVNSIRKSADNIRDMKNGNKEGLFLTDKEASYYNKGQKVDRRIIIKDNNVMKLSRLFGNIQDLLHSQTSLVWSEIELATLRKLYHYNGAKAVQDGLRSKCLNVRSLEAIDKKAKELGLAVDHQINKNNELHWSQEEDEIIKKVFVLLQGLDDKDIAIKLHIDKLPHREVNQIINRWQHIRNKRGNTGKIYERQGLRWEPYEIYILKKNYEYGLPLDVIAEELQRSPNAILSKGQDIGIYRVHRDKKDGFKTGSWGKSEVEKLEKLSKTKSVSQLSEELNRSPDSVRGKLNKKRTKTIADKGRERVESKSEKSTWSDLDTQILKALWDEPDWEEVCTMLNNKTPTQIKKKVISLVKKIDELKMPLFAKSVEFKRV